MVATIFEVGHPRSPSIPFASNLIVFALFNLNLVVFLLLLVLLFRNLVKLSFERRHKVIGARFKAKLVLTFLALALTPGILIFIIASNFITTSIEGWFKPQVEKPLDQAMDVAQTLLPDARVHRAPPRRATWARVMERDGLLDEGKPRGARRVSHRAAGAARRGGDHRLEPPGAGARAREESRRSPRCPRARPNREHIRQALAGQEITTVHELDNGDMIQADRAGARRRPAIAGRDRGGRSTCPQRLEARLRGISQAFQEYKQLKPVKNPIKGIYILLFLLMTLIIVFSATWFGLYLARGITDPIAMLAEGTREVAAGNLNYKVTVRADDEIGILVDSFNRMTGDLAASQASSRRRTGTSRPSTARWSSAAATPRPCSRRWPPAWSRSTPRGTSPRSTAPPSGCSA